MLGDERQHSTVAKGMMLKFRSQCCPLLPLWPWADYSTCLDLSFLIWKIWRTLSTVMDGMLGFPTNSYTEVLNSRVVFRHGTSKNIIKVKWNPKGGALMSYDSCLLIKDTRKLAHLSSLHKHGGKATGDPAGRAATFQWLPREGTLTTPTLPLAPWPLDFASLKLWKYKCLFEPVYGILLW